MAESIVRLRVESSEYDAKLKRASDNLRQYVDGAKKAGESVSQASKDTVEFVRALGNMDTVAKNTNGQMREITRTVTDMTMQYRALTEEEKNSPFGRAMAQSIQQLTERAAEARDAMGDITAAINNAASDTRAFDQISQGATVVTSSFQTLQGAAKLVGIEMGDNVEVLAKLQAAMAVTNGLTTIQNALQKQSALMQGIVAVQARARAAAEALATSGTKAATVAQAAFNAVAKANPYVLLATAIAGVAAAFSIFSSGADEATDAEKRNKEATESLKKSHADFAQRMRDDIGSSVAQTVAKFVTLQDQWKRLKTEAEQKRWIDSNQSAFNALGLSVNSVNDAYKIFVDRAPEVIAALQAIAEAKALESFKQKETERYLEMKYFSGDNKRSTENGGLYTKVDPNQTYRFGMPQEWRDAGLQFGVDYDRKTIKGSRQFYLTSSGEQKINQLRNNQAVDLHNKQLKQQQEQIEQIDRDYDKAMEKATKLSANLPVTTGGGAAGGVTRGGGGTRNTPPPEGSIAAQEALVQSLTKKWREAADQAGRDGYLKQLEEAKEKLAEMQGKTDDIVDGSMRALTKELQELQAEQQDVTSTEDWQAYETRIKAVKKQMSDLKGEMSDMETGFSGLTGNSLSAWISAQQSSLGGMELGGSGYMQTAANIIDAQTLQNVLNATIAKGIAIDPAVKERLFEQLISGEDIPDSVWVELAETINSSISEMEVEPIKIDVETGNVTGLGKQVKDSWQDAARAVQSVGSAMQQLEDPAAKIAGIVGQAIAQIALGFAQATAADSKLGVFGWIAAIAGGLGTMISTISAIHSATGYAEGGIVRGNSYSGDNLWGPSFGINAGELVLNRAQQGALAGQLTSGEGNGGAHPYVTGEMIYLGLTNYLKRRGLGEMVTSR